MTTTFDSMIQKLDGMLQRLEELFPTKSVESVTSPLTFSATPTTTSSTSLSSPASSTTPPSTTPVTPTSIDDTMHCVNTTVEPLKVTPARCSTPSLNHNTKCSEDWIVTTSPTKCSTQGHNNFSNMFNTSTCRHTTTGTPATSSGIVLSGPKTEGLEAQNEFEELATMLGSGSRKLFSCDFVDVTMRQPWPPPILLEMQSHGVQFRPIPWPSFDSDTVGGMQTKEALSSMLDCSKSYYDRLVACRIGVCEVLLTCEVTCSVFWENASTYCCLWASQSWFRLGLAPSGYCTQLCLSPGYHFSGDAPSKLTWSSLLLDCQNQFATVQLSLLSWPLFIRHTLTICCSAMSQFHTGFVQLLKRVITSLKIFWQCYTSESCGVTSKAMTVVLLLVIYLCPVLDKLHCCASVFHLSIVQHAILVFLSIWPLSARTGQQVLSHGYFRQNADLLLSTFTVHSQPMLQALHETNSRAFGWAVHIGSLHWPSLIDNDDILLAYFPRADQCVFSTHYLPTSSEHLVNSVNGYFSVPVPIHTLQWLPASTALLDMMMFQLQISVQSQPTIPCTVLVLQVYVTLDMWPPFSCFMFILSNGWEYISTCGVDAATIYNCQCKFAAADLLALILLLPWFDTLAPGYLRLCNFGTPLSTSQYVVLLLLSNWHVRDLANEEALKQPNLQLTASREADNMQKLETLLELGGDSKGRADVVQISGCKIRLQTDGLLTAIIAVTQLIFWDPGALMFLCQLKGKPNLMEGGMSGTLSWCNYFFYVAACPFYLGIYLWREGQMTSPELSPSQENCRVTTASYTQKVIVLSVQKHHYCKSFSKKKWKNDIVTIHCYARHLMLIIVAEKWGFILCKGRDIQLMKLDRWSGLCFLAASCEEAYIQLNAFGWLNLKIERSILTAELFISWRSPAFQMVLLCGSSMHQLENYVESINVWEVSVNLPADLRWAMVAIVDEGAGRSDIQYSVVMHGVLMESISTQLIAPRIVASFSPYIELLEAQWNSDILNSTRVVEGIWFLSNIKETSMRFALRIMDMQVPWDPGSSEFIGDFVATAWGQARVSRREEC